MIREKVIFGLKLKCPNIISEKGEANRKNKFWHVFCCFFFSVNYYQYTRPNTKPPS